MTIVGRGARTAIVGWGALALVGCGGVAWQQDTSTTVSIARPGPLPDADHQPPPHDGVEAPPYLVEQAPLAEPDESSPLLVPEGAETNLEPPPAEIPEAPPAPSFAEAEAVEAEAGVDDWGEVEELEEVSVHDPNEPGDHWHGDAYPRIERALNIPFARTLRPGTFLFTIDHRNFQSVTDEPFRDFFGFDSGNLKIGIGLRYGILEQLDVGLYRVNGTVEPFDVYEFDARVQFLHQERHGLDAAVRGGLTWFEQEKQSDAVGGFGQLFVTRQLGPRVTLGTGFLFHSDSTSDDKRAGDDAESAAIPLVTEFRLLPWLAFDAEASFGVVGFTADNPIFSFGPKIITNRHTFSVLLSNSQFVSADGIVTNSERDFDDLILGFAITRELGGEW